MPATPQFAKGDKVVFIGFSSESEDPPENADLLEEGGIYAISAVSAEDEDEVAYLLEVENPDFDPKKRASKANAKTLTVDVFQDEIEADDTAEEEAEEEAEEVEEEEEVAPKKAAKKKVAKKKVAKKKVAAKKAAVEDEEGEEEDTELGDLIRLSDDQQDEEIMALVSDSEDLVETAQDAVAESTTADYRMGGILYNLKLRGAYKQHGDGQYAEKGGWAKFCDEVLGLQYRKAQYLLDIYAKFRFHGLGADEVAKLGWTKCSQMASIMDEGMKKAEVKALVKTAEKSTVEELKASIQEVKQREGKDTRETTTFVTMKFRFTEEQGQVNREAIEACMKMHGYTKEEEAISHILTEWAQQNVQAPTRRAGKKRVAKAA